METILVKVVDCDQQFVSPGVLMKDYVLVSAASLVVKCEVTEENLRKFKYTVIRCEEKNEKFETVGFHFIAVYYCDLIRTTLDYDLTQISSEISVPNKNYGIFILLSSRKSAQVVTGVEEFFDHLLPLNRKMIGSPVVIISTPFCNLFLFNAHSSGVICNVLGRDQCMFLTDVKLSLGCEGAPIFSIYGDLIGTVLSVFTWCKGEWMGFTLAIHLYPVLKSWLNSLKEKNIQIKEILPDRYSFIEDIDSYGVVLISGNGIWGSGVLVDKTRGLIITCSHVVSYSPRTYIQVEYKRETFAAEVLYATDKNSPFDVAVVRVSSNFKAVREFKTPVSVVIKGEPVYMIGYPLFSFKNHTIQGPSVSYGHVANVFREAMIVVACASNSGSSGGALMRKNGELLGIVSNNFMVKDLLVPHMTVVIPTSVFMNSIRKFGKSKDVSVFKHLKSNDRNILRIWRMEPNCKL